MAEFDIYNAKFSWHGCDDVRPWLIIQFRPNNVYGCVPIESECYGGQCFFISDADPDFTATGLKKSCYVHDERIYDLPAVSLRAKRGRLKDDLLDRFRKFSGL